LLERMCNLVEEEERCGGAGRQQIGRNQLQVLFLFDIYERYRIRGALWDKRAWVALWIGSTRSVVGRGSLRWESRSVVGVEGRCGRECVTLWKRRRTVVGEEDRCGGGGALLDSTSVVGDEG
jgi:hypothetical protein